MFCPKCGSWNPEDEKTCRACGATIVADADHDTLADIVSRLDKMYA